ncbi:oligosaccharide flippase family protein [Enterocloster aldenensis]|uniref:oligosaccharide flippase family protein n=1 Tax=Enterocloster aldenensis TaxID=358742 RepID=UPI00402781CA
MSQVKYLAKNVGLLSLGQLGTKILTFLLVPLYTNILTTDQYGTYDLINTTVSLLVPILTLNTADSALRFSLEKRDSLSSIFTTSLKYILVGSIAILLLIGINAKLRLLTVLDAFWPYLLMMFICNSFNGVITSFTRGLDRIADIAIGGLICSVFMISLNIAFLILFDMGLKGYFLAHIISTITQTFYLFGKCKCWKYISTKSVKKDVANEMVVYSIPLIANSIAWWINNASDRYIITWLCGLSINGVYSVGYKIPSILNIFQTIFNQAWTLSAVKDFDPVDQNGFFSGLYNLYNFGMVIICSILIASSRILAHFLYAKEFFFAWVYVPFLLIAIVFGSLSGYIGGIFSAVKDSKIHAQSTVIGALVNTVLNIVLVFNIGPLGAAIATAVAYLVVWIIRLKHMNKYIQIKLFLVRDSFSYLLLIAQSALLLLSSKDSFKLYISEFVIIVLIVFLYRNEYMVIYKKIAPIIWKSGLTKK